MNPWKRWSKLVGNVALVGVAACGGGHQTRTNTPYSDQSSQRSSGQSGSTMSRFKANEASASTASAVASPVTGKPKQRTLQDEQVTTAEQIIGDMDAAFSRKDVDGLVGLFAKDASVESYLVSRIFNRKEGVCHGHAEIRELARELMKRGKPWGGYETPIVRGNTVAVEFRSASSDAEKFSVDIIEVRNGKIQSLRAYAGWRAVMALTGETRD